MLVTGLVTTHRCLVNGVFISLAGAAGMARPYWPGLDSARWRSVPALVDVAGLVDMSGAVRVPVFSPSVTQDLDR